MLDYPPLSRGPLFQVPANKAFLESPYRSFAHTHKEICRLEMCSTIRPLPGADYLSFLQS